MNTLMIALLAACNGGGSDELWECHANDEDPEDGELAYGVFVQPDGYEIIGLPVYGGAWPADVPGIFDPSDQVESYLGYDTLGGRQWLAEIDASAEALMTVRELGTDWSAPVDTWEAAHTDAIVASDGDTVMLLHSTAYNQPDTWNDPVLHTWVAGESQGSQRPGLPELWSNSIHDAWVRDGVLRITDAYGTDYSLVEGEWVAETPRGGYSPTTALGTDGAYYGVTRDDSTDAIRLHALDGDCSHEVPVWTDLPVVVPDADGAVQTFGFADGGVLLRHRLADDCTLEVEEIGALAGDGTADILINGSGDIGDIGFITIIYYGGC